MTETLPFSLDNEFNTYTRVWSVFITKFFAWESSPSETLETSCRANGTEASISRTSPLPSNPETNNRALFASTILFGKNVHRKKWVLSENSIIEK